MSKITKILLIFFIVTFNLFLPTFSKAESFSSSTKDSDYDGLTDQGEVQIYGTNPLNADTDSDAYLDGAEVLAGTDPLKQNSSASVIPSKQDSSPWPWYFARSSGLVSYFLLFLLVLSGVGIKTSQSFKILSPTFAWLNHRYLGIALSFFVFVHLISLLLDGFLKFTIADILIPFASAFKPIFLSLGIIGFYLLLLVIISSIFTIHKFPKAWRLLHYLPYPMFIILFIHGYFIGTDTSAPAILAMYLTTGIIAAAVTLYRLYFFFKQR